MLSAASFDFGGTLTGSSVSKQVVTVTNPSTVALQLSPNLSGDPSFSLSQGCGTTLAAGASCSLSVTYAPTVASGSTPQAASLNLGLANVPAGTAQSVAITGTSATLPAGTVAPTANPQVALYSVDLPFAGTVTVSFGPTTTYGRQTWTRSATAAGTVSILVAGMLPNTPYHMQASVQLANGSKAVDADHTFTSGTPLFHANFAATTTPGLTPQPGVEQFSITNGVFSSLVVTDLQGNTIWTYGIPGDSGGYNVEGAKLMSNGDFLITLGQGSAYSYGPPSTTSNDLLAVREIDLAGNTVKQITTAQLSAKLQAAGYNLSLLQFHHDVVPLDNGHWLVLSNTVRNFTDLTGYPGTTTVLGDVVIDLDENMNPVWVWDEFDHLDVNHHPWNFPDWTHTNAIVYSPSDGNLIISMRHQNWVVKVDYQNGKGTGNVLWHLGQGGDFKLGNGIDPTDWSYAQHFPALFSTNSSGVFSLGLMDNGDDRAFPPGVACDTAGQPACLYTTVPVYQIDETAKTATLNFHQILPTSQYSFFGGAMQQLANGNVEYELAGLSDGSSAVYEVTPTATPQVVWHMSSSQAYRGYRIPSLYPGVQW